MHPLPDLSSFTQQQLDTRLRNSLHNSDTAEATRTLLAGANPNTHPQDRTANAFEIQLFRICQSTHHADPEFTLLRLMLQCGAAPNPTNISTYGDLTWMIYYSFFLSSDKKAELISDLLDRGAYISNNWLNQPSDPLHNSAPSTIECTIHQRHRAATKRWKSFIADTPPNVASLTPEDLCLFANINCHHQALSPQLWRGHEVQLQKLLSKSPLWIMHEVAPKLTALQQPSTTISDWNAEPHLTREPAR